MLMKLGRAIWTDCAQAARNWLTLATVRVPTGTEQIRVESGERGLRVERGTEGKLEGRAMLGMVPGLVYLWYEHTDVPCLARYGDGGGRC